MNSTPDAPARPAIRSLTQLEARVLGVLVEKQHTVPDTYPLSLNALTSGCNQKTARAPVMNVVEADVVTAIDGLKRLSLVFEGSSSRVPRFEHNMNRVFGIPSQSAALLTTLLLRGSQTAAELRLNAARLHGFADVSSSRHSSIACRQRSATRHQAGAHAGRARKSLDAFAVRRSGPGRSAGGRCNRRWRVLRGVRSTESRAQASRR
jgi:uncharacterized protein YceH (UPF0502 family)